MPTADIVITNRRNGRTYLVETLFDQAGWRGQVLRNGRPRGSIDGRLLGQAVPLPMLEDLVRLQVEARIQAGCGFAH